MYQWEKKNVKRTALYEYSLKEPQLLNPKAKRLAHVIVRTKDKYYFTDLQESKKYKSTLENSVTFWL